MNFCNKIGQKALVNKKTRNIKSRYDIINIRICIYVFKLNEIAVKIKHTNLPDKSENCLDKTLSSLEREKAINCHPELDSGSIPICSEYDKSKSLTLSSSAQLVQHDIVIMEGLL